MFPVSNVIKVHSAIIGKLYAYNWTNNDPKRYFAEMQNI
jgi:hypothetical protein